VPDDVFLEELQFYQISDSAIVEYKVKEGFLVEKVGLVAREYIALVLYK